MSRTASAYRDAEAAEVELGNCRTTKVTLGSGPPQ